MERGAELQDSRGTRLLQEHTVDALLFPVICDL